MSTELTDFFKDLEWRELLANHANLDNFYQLKPQEKIVYFGIDCTAESLHIGHLFLLFQTIRFAQTGFTVLLVLGGATGKIGDPSDKLKERPQLEPEKVDKYQKKIQLQLEKILIEPKKIEQVNYAPLELFYSDNSELLNNIYKILQINKKEKKEQWEKYLNYIWPLTENKFKILNNNNWLSKINFIDFIDKVGRKITVNYLLAKETIKQRINSETGLSFLAFSYSLLQAYDFYYLYKNYNCHGQLGGSDQWGNLTTGLELIRKNYSEKNKINKTFVFTFNLLTDKEGKKLSKSESRTLKLDSDKKDFFDFFRNLPDEQAEIYLKQFTFLNSGQIKELLKLNNPKKLRIPQRILTELLFYLLHGKNGCFSFF